MAICRWCGREIVWGVDEKGTRIPLDPRAPVYKLGAPDEGGETYRVTREGDCKVSHFATCTKIPKDRGGR